MSPEAMSSSSIDGAPTTERRMRVLVAEDNLVNQRVTSGFLKLIGCESRLTANGLEVIEAFCNEGADLILMDCNMPELDGIEATRRIRKYEADHSLERTPIIALTAHAFSEIVQQCRDAGMDDHLAKPIMLEDLRAAIDRHRNQSS
jgi:CheY-like chemotaxis protein